MAVKMRVSKGDAKCTSCGGVKGKNKVKVMYDICLGTDISHLCQLCMADLLKLTCRMNAEYYARVKSKDEV